VATERTYYDILGVALTASDTEIRDAYRQRAREVHPDSAARTTANSSARMAEISQAWAVLSDPVRRRQYDAVSVIAIKTEISETETRRETEQFVERAKFPWRFMLVLLFVGIIVVLVLDAMSQPAVPAGPDGLLRSGSCIVIDANLAAVEVRCEDAHDGVVQQLVGFDMACPQDTEAIRDRQGMGLACVVRN